MNNIKSIVSTAALALLCHTAGAQGNATAANLMTHRGLVAQKSLTTKSTRPQTVKVLKAAKKKALDTQSPFYGRTFYGSLINSTDWANSSITNVPYGIYSFELNDDIEPKAQVTNMVYNFESGAYTGGEFFGIYTMDVMGALNGARYITLDTDNWKEKSHIMHDASDGSYSLLSASMAYNYIDNNIYSFQYNDELNGLNWCKYNTQYHFMDKLAAFRGKYNILATATTPDGEMYFINAYGDLYKVNKTNGRPSLIAWTGVTPILYTQSMLYDNRTGLFLWAAITENGSELYSVDPETGATTFLTKFKKQEQFSAIYSLDEGAKDGAPAKADDLKLSFEQDGGLNGNITFGVPTTTFDGKALGSTLLNVWLDGKNLKGVTAQPGEKINIPVELEEGNHYVAVNMKNESGWSPLASVKQFAGYDTPVAIEEVKFENEEGQNKVTWSAPTEGINKGYIDNGNLKYTIVRMPDSVTVAKDYNATTYSEPTPSVLHSYSYRVYVINKDKTSAFTESNKVTCGDAFTVPYSQGFDSEATFKDYFTVIDNDNDGTTWRYQDWGHIVRYDLNAEKADDWLVTPAIKLEGGKEYKCTLNLKTFSKGYPEYFEILVGTDPHDVSTFKSVKNVEGLEQYETYSDYSTTFKIEESKKYYLAIRYLGEKAKNSSMLLLTKISVSEIGKTQAPAASSQLTITPGENDAMEATISFVAPNKDLNGNDIKSLSKINVYRNGEKTPIHSFEAPTVSSELKWIDKKVSKVGMNTYTIKAENEFGEGAAAIDSAFIGCYVAPYSENFSSRASAGYYTTYMEGVDLEENESYQWKYDDSNQRMTIYCFNAEDKVVSSWLITPLIKLDANSVYTLGYKKNYSPYKESIIGNVYMGKEATIEGQSTLVGAIKKNAGWGMEDGSNTVVTKDAGKYCFGFNIKATAQWDNIMCDMDDITLNYVKSALCPYNITDYQATPDPNGSLRCAMSFKAPAVDYQGNPLTENLTINIYRGNNTIPVYTINDVTPGSEVKWTDTQAQKGINKYTIIANNKYGKGESFTHSLYVGIDRPSKVENLAIKGSADNMTANISWEAPTKGCNGGVVPADKLTYRILEYDATENALSIVADNVKEQNYSIARPDLKKQEVVYYGVVAKIEEEIGDTIISSCTLGKLYDVPFKESFTNKELSTSPWIISSSNTDILNWGVSDPTGGYYNNATPQDNDGGCAYFYNGSYYETYAGAGFISPKVALGSNTKYLTFWAYNYPAKYTKLPYVLVYARVDDGQFQEIGRYQIAEKDGEEGWKKYSIELSSIKEGHFISFGFYAYTDGYQECIYLDNINVGDETTGIKDIQSDGKDIERINWHDLNGRSIIAPSKGVYIKTITYTDGSKKSIKVTK